MTTVAIVHDYLTQKGGAERVVLSMMKAFPDATLHTSLYHPAGTFPEFAALAPRTLAINRLPLLRRRHRCALPLLGPSFAHHTVDADVVLCSSSGWSHCVRTAGRKLVYCYTPARWLFQGQAYVDGQPLAGAALKVLRPTLVRQDRKAAATAARYLTLSTPVKLRIRDAYGIDAEVVNPPPTLDPDAPRRKPAQISAGFYLCVARLLAYKNVGAVVGAFVSLPGERLIVVGAGPERRHLEATAGPNVSFLGAVDDDELRWLYDACAAVVAASYEDYGLTPLEAASFGRPSAVLRAGGFVDTVVEHTTGVFFDRPVAADIARAVRALGCHTWSQSVLTAHAARFGQDQFIHRLQAVVAEVGSDA